MFGTFSKYPVLLDPVKVLFFYIITLVVSYYTFHRSYRHSRLITLQLTFTMIYRPWYINVYRCGSSMHLLDLYKYVRRIWSRRRTIKYKDFVWIEDVVFRGPVLSR